MNHPVYCVVGYLFTSAECRIKSSVLLTARVQVLLVCSRCPLSAADRRTAQQVRGSVCSVDTGAISLFDLLRELLFFQEFVAYFLADRSFQGDVQNLIHGFDKMYFNIFQDRLGNIL